MATTVEVIVTILLVFSFIGGMFAGAVKAFFSFLALILSVLIAALCFQYLAAVLGFFSTGYWQGFFGFFIILLVVKIIFEILLFLPRQFIKAIWRKGILYRLLGGFFGLVETSLFLAVVALLIQTFPFWTFLEDAVNSSVTLEWLITKLGLVHWLLLGTLENARATY